MLFNAPFVKNHLGINLIIALTAAQKWMKKLMNNTYINKEIAKLRFTDWYHESYTDE